MLTRFGLSTAPQRAGHVHECGPVNIGQHDRFTYRGTILLHEELQVGRIPRHLRVRWQMLQDRLTDQHDKLTARPCQGHIKAPRIQDKRPC
jgi:hypothetical protein